MREVLLLALCLCACAKSKAGGPDPSQVDLMDPGDLSGPSPDLSGPAPDLTGTLADLRSGLPDLSGPAPDLSGPPSDLAMADLSNPPPTDLPSYSYPRVNEVATGVAGVELDEYIELVGGDTDTPLFGWALWYQPPGGGIAKQLFSFPLLAKVPAHKYLLITAAGSAYVTSADYTYPSESLPTAGGAVGLFQALTHIDSVGWGTATGGYVEAGAAPSPGGQSCSRIPDGVDTDNNRADFRVASPTPRSVNHL